MEAAAPSREEIERGEILRRYRALLRAVKPFMKKGDKKQLRLAFDMALDAHKDMRRKSGEPYIYHPLEVARIVVEEIGLGTTSVVCALLHDVVEDTEITLEQIEKEFGNVVARIIDGLTKISGLYNKSTNTSDQAENFRKMLLTLADDVRVILIKLADRLHNMRTLDSMPKDKQLKIASETSFLFAPLAHRLGLYAVKSELEDLSLKYTDPEIYKDIARRLQETKLKRDRFIRDFIVPIRKEMEALGLPFEIKGRPKSINSIYNKMRKQGVEFDEVYDLFAIRIILESPAETEKSDCWRAYSIVTDMYQPNPNRLRDWVSTPKANGYESLHTTVMGAGGRWVEVQIRTKRMDEIAEKGLAAHWKYKESGNDNAFDAWLTRIREVLENPEPNALEFIDNFKLQLYAKDVFAFTPKGDLIKLAAGATALDFAFEIHTDIGMKCIGAKVNHKIVPLSYPLQNGDQVEILTSSIQKPKSDWLKFVTTAKAKSKIKQAIKDYRREMADTGRDIFEKKMKQWKTQITEELMNKILSQFKLQSPVDLHYLIATERIDLAQLKAFVLEPNKAAESRASSRIDEKNFGNLVRSNSSAADDLLIIDDKISKIDYTLASCCNPIPGDEIFGFVTISEGIKIHRVNCPNAVHLLSKYSYRVVKSKWTQASEVSFLAGIRITGLDDIGIISGISQVISTDLKVNMRSISVLSNDGMFEGTIMVFVNDTKHLDTLMRKLLQVKGVLKVTRFDSHPD
ncbi:MAG: bifunctional (p)ppGpp synthetase/guanosine-3',5'-bis(diphosphate) 3'-pyrophosphohydrolase [Sphingobacteriaceae bacterium]|nr:bifunctional (p)ppGpp synthetase/guanosine-3',5'-bis(diphosphate) 3'-pyrophosphohydrolase [Sphingobacteriaceae bacterium]